MSFLTVYYFDRTVYEAALARIERLFDEFEEVMVFFSGGKDSTVVLNLALEVAKRRNRLPLKVLFIDQEAEWQCAIDYIREIMNRPDVEPYWFQFPIRIFNATSFTDDWLYCWEPGKTWMREKEPNAITEPICPPDTPFMNIFNNVIEHYWKDKRVAVLGGLRAEENPKRRAGLTTGLTYKDITWAKKLGARSEHYTFYPLYDWSYRDVWKAIHDNQWQYCKLYDYQYQDGIPVMNMRVSNLHHETAIGQLEYLAKVERSTWNKLVKRLGGINSFKNLRSSFFVPPVLPYMFKTWEEYRDYLLDNLVLEDKKPIYRHRFELDKKLVSKYEMSESTAEELIKMQIHAILRNDYYFTTLVNAVNSIKLAHSDRKKKDAQRIEISK